MLTLAALIIVAVAAASPMNRAWAAGTVRATGSDDLDAVLVQSRKAQATEDFLPPEQAFRLSASADGAQRIRLDWIIAPGYYLYRDRIKIADDAATIGATQFPTGQIKSDENFGEQMVYHDELIATVPLTRPLAAGSVMALRVTYQGCAEAGLCYPPITQNLKIAWPTGAAGAGGTGGATQSGYVSEQDRLAALIRSGNLLGVLGTFFGVGLLLAFTPCVLPMVPILSGLIVGQGPRLTTARAFALSLTYVLGMAVTYTATGALFAAAGKQVQAVFQQPWIIVLFAALFVAMACAMFGLYSVQMPAILQTRLAQTSNRQRAGTFGGVAVMGMLSALIVTTCVAPALVATLVVIGQSGAVARGAAALFAMSLGMGAPLLVVGSSAGRWLPRAGTWMDSVKRLFGVLMLGMAAWMLARIVPPRITLLLFAVPALAAAGVFWTSHGARARRAHGRRWLARGAALIAGVYGITLLFGAARGASDLWHPLQRSAATVQTLPFHLIGTVADLRREVQAAAAAHQAVMLDIDADWCTSCKEMQRYTFTDPEVRQALQSVRLLRANVTANSSEDQALLHEFQIYGPPTIAFYDPEGHEQQRFRVVGYMKAANFAALLRQALATS
ncbi:MAG TPA: protein-disulfide reductase DsbD [Steroidobacteraceae bacterium]|nr:protein-disulfide reductase DsbD [Steroidobacteraceae bacterium]